MRIMYNAYESTPAQQKRIKFFEVLAWAYAIGAITYIVGATIGGF